MLADFKLDVLVYLPDDVRFNRAAIELVYRRLKAIPGIKKVMVQINYREKWIEAVITHDSAEEDWIQSHATELMLWGHIAFQMVVNRTIEDLRKALKESEADDN